MWEALLGKLGIDVLKAGIKGARKGISKKEYTELISEAIRELLKLHPNISAAEAKLLAAEALGLSASGGMLTAQKMLVTVKSDRKRKRKRKVKRKAKRKVKKKAKRKAKKKVKRKVKKKAKRKAKRKVKKKAKRKAKRKASRRRR